MWETNKRKQNPEVQCARGLRPLKITEEGKTLQWGKQYLKMPQMLESSLRLMRSTATTTLSQLAFIGKTPPKFPFRKIPIRNPGLYKRRQTKY